MSLRQGDGQFEVPLGVHQVAVSTGATAAQAEVARVAAAVTGTSIVTGDGGVTADGPSSDGIGDAVAVTRRGSAVVLVGAARGEDSMSAAQARVAGYAQRAWELLCRYQVDGCA